MPAGAPELMADRIQTLLQREGLRETFGSEGRRLIEREFSLECKVGALYELFFGQAISRNVPDLTKPFMEAVP